MKKRWKRAVKIKALPPLPLSLTPQSSSRSRVVWSRSCGVLLGSEAVVVEVDQEQLSQVEQTGLPVSWWAEDITFENFLLEDVGKAILINENGQNTALVGQQVDRN